MEMVRHKMTPGEYEAVTFLSDRFESGRILEGCLEYPTEDEIWIVMTECEIWELMEANKNETGDEYWITCLDTSCELSKRLTTAFNNIV